MTTLTDTKDNNLVQFGRAFRQKHFASDPSYLPINHGSYGAFPTQVRDHQHLAAEPDTVKYICESTYAQAYCIGFLFPAEDDEVVDAFVRAVKDLRHQGLSPKLLIFDTVVAFPGVRLPWERLTHACRENHVLSLVDGAHGIGHIDLTMVARIEPEFFTSNCYKWLFTPRACAVIYVSRRNHRLIHSSLPTSHGYHPVIDDEGWLNVQPTVPERDTDLVELFNWVATVDQTPYLCIPEAVRFRNMICGSEDQIRRYCFDLARQGGHLIAKTLGPETMHNSASSLSQCCFTNVRLPLNFNTSNNSKPSKIVGDSVSLDPRDGPDIALWITKQCMTNHSTWIPCGFYGGDAWMRRSAQIYLELDDFWGSRWDALRTVLENKSGSLGFRA